MVIINRERTITSADWNGIMDAFGYADRLRRARTIAIKPNLAAGNKAPRERHICTDVGLLQNIVALCHESNPGARILICESDSTGDGFAYLKFEHFDFPHALDPQGEYGVGVLDLSRTRLTKLTDERFRYFRDGISLCVSSDFVQADFTISLSNLKTHSVTLYTGACKNLFGCLPASTKSVYHPYIHQVVHDLTLALHPDLNIVDAFYAMEKNGPVAGRDIDAGFRIFSTDAYEADVYGTRLIGIDPRRVKYLRYLSAALPACAVDEALIRANRFTARYPGTALRFNNAVGLWIQRFGDGISRTGDRLHIARTPARAVISLFRPLLIRLFGLDRLKRLKHGGSEDGGNGY